MIRNAIETVLKYPAAQYVVRLVRNTSEDYIGLLAAGVAFYFFMAAFPALAALISLYGLFADPAFIPAQLANLEHLLPPESLKILADQATAIASSGNAALGLGFMIGVVLAIFSTTKGVTALIKGLNIAYAVRESRNILMLNYTAFTLTFGMMIYMLFALTLIAFMPAFFNIIHVPDYIATWLLTLRWPLLLLSGMVGLEILYHFAPDHPDRRWKWISPGSIVATLLWLGGSSLFSAFVSNFGNYNETYGSLGAVAVLLLWFWLSGLTILFGAEINAAFGQRRAVESSTN